jgi:hypothetical protein
MIKQELQVDEDLNLKTVRYRTVIVRFRTACISHLAA